MSRVTVGKESRFAIECKIRKKSSSHIKSAHIAAWIGDELIGDFNDSGNSLYIFASSLNESLKYSKKRHAPELNGVGSTEAIKAVIDPITAWMYKDDPKESKEMDFLVEREEKLRLFGRSPWADSLRDWEVILLETSEAQLMLWQHLGTGHSGEVTLESGEYEQVVQDFLDWYMLQIL